MWTAGTLRVETFQTDLTVPNAGVLELVRSPTGTTIEGAYRQAGGTLAVDIGGAAQFNGYGVLHSEGAATLGGILQLTLTDGFIPTASDSFEVLQADGGLSGAFANVVSGQRLTTSDGVGSFLVS